MPTRRAILISCPGTGEKYLLGADKDITNMVNYLTSPRGGDWRSNEITCLNNPTWQEAYQVINKYMVDYQFIYFAGHGSADQQRTRFLMFKDGEVEDLLLLNAIPKQLVIADACRVCYPTISGISPAEDVYSSFTGVSAARSAFDQCILKSPNGKIIVNATLHGEEAREERYGRGGAFTLSLLHAALNFKTGTDLSPVMIAELMNNTQRTLWSQAYTQVPEIVWSIGELRVPFLIDTEQIISTELEEPAPKISEVEKGNWVKVIAASILVIAIIKGLGD
jgi:hypothetical protein